LGRELFYFDFFALCFNFKQKKNKQNEKIRENRGKRVGLYSLAWAVIIFLWTMFV